jgi:hypothetical protein
LKPELLRISSWKTEIDPDQETPKRHKAIKTPKQHARTLTLSFSSSGKEKNLFEADMTASMASSDIPWCFTE